MKCSCGEFVIKTHLCPYEKEVNLKEVVCTCCPDCEDGCIRDLAEEIMMAVSEA